MHRTIVTYLVLTLLSALLLLWAAALLVWLAMLMPSLVLWILG